MLTGAWVMYGFDTAGGLAEETINPTREVPRAMLFAVGITAVISAFWLVAMVLAIPDVAKTQAQSTGAIAYIFHAHFPNWVTNAFLISVCVAIFVCCLAIQAATTRLLYAYGRDKMIPGHKFFGYVHPRTKTPMTSAIFVAVAAIVVLLYVTVGGADPFVQIARVTAWATAGTYIAYQMVVFGGLVKRSKGWPKDKAYFNLGRWGWPVNIIAFVYGVFMIINLSWPRQSTSWLDTYIVMLSLGVVVVVGAIVYVDPAGARHRPERDDPRDRLLAGRCPGGRRHGRRRSRQGHARRPAVGPTSRGRPNSRGRRHAVPDERSEGTRAAGRREPPRRLGTARDGRPGRAPRPSATAAGPGLPRPARRSHGCLTGALRGRLY